MTLIPGNGISSRRFAAWMDQQNMNTINDLMEMGFIHPKNNREILLHPMIREVAVEELKPSVRSCSVLLDSLQEISLMHGLDFMNNKQVFHTVESIIVASLFYLFTLHLIKDGKKTSKRILLSL